MSVQEVKGGCGYDPNPVAPRCGNCRHFEFERALPGWMVKDNGYREAIGMPPAHNVDAHGLERGRRCGLLGFATKKGATCVKWEGKP